jgi:hypothetical protein
VTIPTKKLTQNPKNYRLTLLQKQMNPTYVIVAILVLLIVYYMDPTFFGLLGKRAGFQDMPKLDCADEEFRKANPDLCPEESFEDMMEKEKKPTSTGEMGPGQMQVDGPSQVTDQQQPHVAEGFEDGPANFGSAQSPMGCYPRDQLTPAELLPKESANVWSQQNPMGSGSLKGKNFLSAGALIGVNTVGQSLRNASWDLRSTPPNPQMAVSIFNNSTIEPDVNRRPLEIG